MESYNPNDEDNPPAFTFQPEEHDEFALTVSQDGAADCGGIFHDGDGAGTACMSLPVTPCPWENMHANYQSCPSGIPGTGGNLMVDFMRLNSLQNPQIDPNFLNIRSNTPRVLNLSDTFPEQSSMRGIHQSINQDYNMTADNVINCDAGFGSSENPQIDRNFMSMRGNQMTRQGGEAKGRNINRPQISGNFVNLGGSGHMLYHTRNSGQNEIDKNVKVSAHQFGCPEKIDGSFLSLGIGCNIEARPKSKFNSRDITSKLQEALSPTLNTSHARKTTSSSSLGHKLTAGFPSFQSTGGVSSPACDIGGWTSSKNDIGAIHGANTRLSSSPFHISQTPQIDVQPNISMPSDRNSDFVSRRDARYEDLNPYKGFQGEQAAFSSSFSSSSAGFLSSRQIRRSGLASEPSKSMWINTQTASDQLQQCHTKTAKNFSSGSSMNSPFHGLRRSSTRRDHSGRLFPAWEGSATLAAESDQFPRRIDAQPAGQLFSAHDNSAPQFAGGNLFPGRIGDQVIETSVQGATVGLFPKRLGVQVNEGAAQAAEGGLFTKGLSIQTDGKHFQPQDSASVQFPKNLLGPPIAIGRPEHGMPVQFSRDLRGPSSTAGQRHSDMPVQFSKDFQRPASTTGQGPVARVNRLSQASDVLGRPFLKRGAIRPPPAAPWGQRRKITQPMIRPSMPYPPQTAFFPIPMPAPDPSHIKCQGLDEPPQPTGQKCMLCKRDLSFTPEGPVYQPAVPPAVAVLPCGHTFHDHCLQIITPENQSKNPPCIPCAMGEH